MNFAHLLNLLVFNGCAQRAGINIVEHGADLLPI